ncbi:MAG: hypothetical protein C7B45_10845 [Sulfobacillus acidophilus]|uniref:Uncharacterized protein n=1 Tax=Sulfobacillus acidophilus TaxID=53633 RepID=A0A2T2WGS5_9FIRM|nr:MAG: hypothetical protein C7B45_10845 [Sulfobacillus acidophilus]
MRTDSIRYLGQKLEKAGDGPPNRIRVGTVCFEDYFLAQPFSEPFGVSGLRGTVIKNADPVLVGVRQVGREDLSAVNFRMVEDRPSWRERQRGEKVSK